MTRQSLGRVHVRYTGRVQGVGFRATCAWIATSHPVSGWVRNEADGAVTLEAQGGPEAVEEFLHAIADRMRENIASAHRVVIAVIHAETGFVITR